MKKISKIALIVAFSATFLLILSFFLGFTVRDMVAFYSQSYAYTKAPVVTINEPVTSLIFISDEKNFVVNTHEETYIEITYYIHEEESVTFSVEDDTLTVIQESSTKWFNFISFGSPARKYRDISILLPENIYTMNVEIATGNIELNDLTLTNLTTKVSVGNSAFSDLEIAGDLSSSGEVGNLSITNTNVLGETSLKTSTGNISATNVDTSALESITSTGNINLYNMSAPLLEAKTTTGNLSITIDYSDYNVNLLTGTGQVKVDGTNHGKVYTKNDGSKTLRGETETGDITLTKP